VDKTRLDVSGMIEETPEGQAAEAAADGDTKTEEEKKKDWRCLSVISNINFGPYTFFLNQVLVCAQFTVIRCICKEHETMAFWNAADVHFLCDFISIIY